MPVLPLRLYFMRFHYTKAPAALILLATLLTACGGGGNDQSANTVPPNTSALRVTSAAPADGASAAVDVVPTITFDAAPGSNPGSLRLRSPAADVPGTLTVSDAVATFKPAAPLVWGTRYQLEVPAGFGSSRKLGSAYTSSFDTRPLAWTPVSTLQASATGAKSQRIGALANGDMVFVWWDYRDNRTDIKTATFSQANRSWSTPVALNSPGPRIDNFDLQTNASGGACAVWDEVLGQDGNNTRIVASLRDPATGQWSAPQQISRAGTSPQYGRPALALDKAGNVAVAWLYHQGSAGDSIDTAYYNASARTWQTSTSPVAGAGDLDFPAVAIASNGDAHVLWSLRSTSRHGINAWRYDAARQTWLATQSLATQANNNYVHALRADDHGNVFAISVTNEGTLDSGRRAQVLRYDGSTQQWSGALAFAPAAGQGAGNVMLAVTPGGSATVAWTESIDGSLREQVRVQRYSPSINSWSSAPTLPVSETVGYMLDPVLAGDSAGNIVLAWGTYDNSNDTHLYSARLANGAGGWGARTELHSGSAVYGWRLALDEQGQAMLVWELYQGRMASDDMQFVYARLLGQ